MTDDDKQVGYELFMKLLDKEAGTEKIVSDGNATAYYDFPEGCNTLNDLIEYKKMSFARGNIFKAVYRLDEKQGIDEEYDLNKIIYYANRMLAVARKKKNSSK